MAVNLYVVLPSAFIAWYIISSIAAWYRLRHFPGPLLARFSSIHKIWTSYTFQSYLKYANIGKDYANHQRALVRIGPNELITSDPDIIRRMSGPRSQYRRSSWYSSLRPNPFTENMISTTDTAAHDRLKASTAPGYGLSSSAWMEEAIDPQVSALVDLLRRKYLSKPGDFKRVDIGFLSKYLALDVISRLAYGRQGGHLATDSDLHGYVEFFNVFPFQLQMRSELPVTNYLLMSPMFLRFFGPRTSDKKGVGKLMGQVQNATEEWKKSESDKKNAKDLVKSFLSAGLGAEQSEAEVLLQLSAGYHTTAMALYAAMLYILTTPRVYDTLKAEIAKGIENGSISSPITTSEARSMPYLQAVINESLRICVPVSALFTKEVPPGGDTLQGRFVPGGTHISHNMWALGRDELVFGKDVDLFRPERWLEHDIKSPGRAAMQAQLDLVFGYGRWICVGKNLARMEMEKCIVELFRHFDMQLLYPGKGMDLQQAVLFNHGSLWVEVKESEAK